MKNLLMVSRATVIHRLTARLAVIVLFAALLSAVPFNAAFAQTAPALGSAGSFAALGGTAVSLTDSAVIGNVGSPVAVTLVRSTVVGTVYPVPNDPIVVAAYGNFLSAYDALALVPCNVTLTGTLAGVTLTPDVYCFDAAATLTGQLTLDALGDPNAVWIFKIGTVGTGALTGTNFSVVMANGGQPCNVYWWTAQAATMTTSSFKGNILAGAGTTFTGGSVIGRALAQAGLTMTGTDVFGCSSLVPTPPPPPIEYCKDYCKDYCSDYWWNDHDNYHCKDHDNDYCKDHNCMDHDKNRCKDHDRDHDRDRDKDHDKDHRDRR